MANDRCPWCGAEKRASLSGQMRRTYQCRSVCFDDRPEEAWRSTACHLSEAKQLKARVAKLEEALKRIAARTKPIDGRKLADDVMIGDLADIASEALADTHGPGTMAGDAARIALRTRGEEPVADLHTQEV